MRCCVTASTRMDAREETLNLLSKIWVKLQGLPNANPIDLGAFFILLTFIREYLYCYALLSYCFFFLKTKLIMTLFIRCSLSQSWSCSSQWGPA